MDMMEVVEYYYQTIDKQHPEGNMKEVAEHFKITRAKVQKILFTMEAIDSPLHQDIMKLKEEGYDNEDIASMLGVSVSTVSINLPYAKPMYGQDEKSRGAIDVENYRKREKVFLEGQKRKATALEITREAYLNSPEHLIAEMMKQIESVPNWEYAGIYKDECSGTKNPMSRNIGIIIYLSEDVKLFAVSVGKIFDLIENEAVVWMVFHILSIVLLHPRYGSV